MAWIKSSKHQNLVVVLFLLSFSMILSGQIFMGICFLLMAWSKSWSQVTVLQGYKGKGEVAYAGFWLRVGSALADWFFLAFIFASLYFAFGQKINNDLGRGLYLLAYLLIELFTLKSFGQTPGNMLMGIKVVKLDYSELTWYEIFVRMFLKILFVLGTLLTAYLVFGGIITPAFMVAHGNSTDVMYKDFAGRLKHLTAFWVFSEFIVLLINRRKRGLQDYMAGTVVIKIPKEKYPRILWRICFFTLAPLLFFCFFWICAPSIFQFRSDQGDPEAQKIMGDLYLRGWAVHQDYQQSLEWYRKSAKQGDADAQERIGEVYDSGLGLPKDQTLAIQWYTQAAQNGSRAARGRLKKLGINNVPSGE